MRDRAERAVRGLPLLLGAVPERGPRERGGQVRTQHRCVALRPSGRLAVLTPVRVRLDLSDCGWRAQPRVVPQGIARSNDCYLNGVLKNRPTSTACIDFNDHWAVGLGPSLWVVDQTGTFVDADGDGTPDPSTIATSFYSMKQCGLGTQVRLVTFTSTPEHAQSLVPGRRVPVDPKASTSRRARPADASRPATTRPAATLRTASCSTRRPCAPTGGRGAGACPSSSRGSRAAAQSAPTGSTSRGRAEWT